MLWSGGSAASDLVIQVVMISESTRLQCMLANYGIQTQTPTEVEPVQIWPPGETADQSEASILTLDQSQASWSDCSPTWAGAANWDSMEDPTGQ